MDSISAFDIIKIGIGPSSSHTMGPWRAAESFLNKLDTEKHLGQVERIEVTLYGSLALTGIGHGSDIAVLMGLSGEDFTTIDTRSIPDRMEAIRQSGQLCLGGRQTICFSYAEDLILEKGKSLPEHPNGMRFTVILVSGETVSESYYSVGGGFVLTAGKVDAIPALSAAPFACHSAKAIESYCAELDCTFVELILRNEKSWRSEEAIREKALGLWKEIAACLYRGICSEGVLPGGLGVKRRARKMNQTLMGDVACEGLDAWLNNLKHRERSFTHINKWVSCFALAVSEENASFGRVVTAPTNGASGVLPAVLMYGFCFEDFTEEQIVDFILVAGEIGTLFKKNATISGAMGGCQAEIGVSSAMAAAALTACRGGSTGQILMAAEVAMEHHLGMTCDPVGGLVQIPCIERNSMGAIKAITAANLAMEGDPEAARVRLDDVIATMWNTAQDMNSNYKETSRGGLAMNVAVSNAEC